MHPSLLIALVIMTVLYGLAWARSISTQSLRMNSTENHKWPALLKPPPRQWWRDRKITNNNRQRTNKQKTAKKQRNNKQATTTNKQ